jgi:hypothetical protein
MQSLLRLSFMLSILSVTGSALAQASEWSDSACLWANDTLVCAYPVAVHEEGVIPIIVDGQDITTQHLESRWWPLRLDWYEVQLRAECVRPESSITIRTTSEWGVAPRVDCPEGSSLVNEPSWFKIRIRELP